MLLVDELKELSDKARESLIETEYRRVKQVLRYAACLGHTSQCINVDVRLRKEIQRILEEDGVTVDMSGDSTVGSIKVTWG